MKFIHIFYFLWFLENKSESALLHLKFHKKQQHPFRSVNEDMTIPKTGTQQSRWIEESSSTVLQIAGGYAHTCVLLDGPTYHVKCFGGNWNGQLGYGDNNHRLRPTDETVTFPNGLIPMKITTGYYHSCALLQDTQSYTTVWCWGFNNVGQLGIPGNSYSYQNNPVQVVGLPRSDVMDIFSGVYHNCAIFDDNSFYCWGWNYYGQLGRGIDTKVDMMALGLYHTCAIQSIDQSIECWGTRSWSNQWGQLGDSTVLSQIKAKQITAGSYHTCVVQVDNSMTCWGRNDRGQLGFGIYGHPWTSYSSTPVAPENGVSVKSISTGDSHTCATFLDDSAPKCWGLNDWGQIGVESSTTIQAIPKDILVNGNSPIDVIICGAFHSCARFVDGAAKCWGLNYSGQLGGCSNADTRVGDKVGEITNLYFIDYVPTGFCDGECIGQPDTSSCNDGEACTINDTCQSGVCVPGPMVFIDNINTTYTIGNGNVNAQNDGNTYISLTYGFPDIEPELSLVTYEAIVFDNSDCMGSVIGKTENALLGDNDSDTNASLFSVSIDDFIKAAPVVNILAPFENFLSPFWYQTTQCLNTAGNDDNDEVEFCGLLKVCVQLQSHLCGRLVDFKDVRVEAEFDVTTECDGFCEDVKLLREEPADLLTDVQAGFPLSCNDCAKTGNDIPTYNQGDPVTACIKLDPDVEGACILQVTNLDLVVGSPQTTYGIYPQSLLPNNLLLTGDIDYSPDFDDDGASIGFIPPAAEMLNLPINSYVTATFHGTATIGFGCYCDGTCPDGTVRQLQQGDSIVQVKFEGDPYTFQLVDTATVPPDNNVVNCEWYDIVCFFMQIIHSIMSMLGL